MHLASAADKHRLSGASALRCDVQGTSDRASAAGSSLLCACETLLLLPRLTCCKPAGRMVNLARHDQHPFAVAWLGPYALLAPRSCGSPARSA
jgi:hypothetical protein